MYKTMHNLKNRSKDKKGFTLAELLIVVAIIAVLVAIAVPIFTGQLEKAREATDAANIRTAYAVATVAAMEQGTDISAGPIALTQQTAGFASDIKNSEIGGIKLESDATLQTVKEGVNLYVTISGSDGSLKFEITDTTPTGKVIDPITGQE